MEPGLHTLSKDSAWFPIRQSPVRWKYSSNNTHLSPSYTMYNRNILGCIDILPGIVNQALEKAAAQDLDLMWRANILRGRMSNVPLSMHMNIIHHQLEDKGTKVKKAEIDVLEWTSLYLSFTSELIPHSEHVKLNSLPRESFTELENKHPGERDSIV